MEQFPDRNGTMTSLQKYYETKYNKAIRDLKQPLIITLPKVSLPLFKLQREGGILWSPPHNLVNIQTKFYVQR